MCDEPTDLDRETATEILDLLQILNRDHGKTILMVTHDPVAADFAKEHFIWIKADLLTNVLDPH